MKQAGSVMKRQKRHSRMLGRLLAIALAAVLGLSGLTPVSNVQAEGVRQEQQSVKDTRMLDSEFETAQDLGMEGSEVSLEEEQSAYFKFVPQTDGIYVFSTDGDCDTYGQLYSGDGESLACEGDSGNFSISYYLKADTEYYLLARQYDYESASFTLNVEQRQPEGLEVFYIPYMEVAYGEPAILEVLAVSDVGEITYQWYKVDQSEDVEIKGATESTYELPAVNTENNYCCHVTDGSNEQWVWIDISIDTGLRVSSDVYDEDGDAVTDVQVPYGGVTELKVKAEGGIGELTYQWYTGDDVNSLIEGATGRSYEVKGNSGCGSEFRCAVTDGIVTRSVWFYITLDSGLRVNSDIYDEEGEPVRDVRVTYGETTELKVKAEGGAGELTYQWHKLDDEKSLIEGENGSSYEVQGDRECGSIYRCDVTDGVVTRSVWFYVTLDTGLIVSSSTGEDHYGQGGSSEYRKVYLKLGDTVSLEVTASGGIVGNGLTYEWYARGNIIEGQTSNRYVLSGNKECKDVYRCEVSDGVVTRTVMFYIDLNTGLKAVSGTGTNTNESQAASSSRNVLVEYQKKVTLEVTASSQIGEVSYEWYKDHSDGTIEGAAGNSFEVSGIAGSEGTYICRVSDGVASRDVLFYVKVDTGLNVSSSTGTDWGGKDGNSDTRDVTAKYGKKNLLEVTANGGIGKLTYRWYKETHSYEKVMIEGANTNRYELLGEANAPIWYYCVVTDGVASRTVGFRITLDNGLKAVSDVGTDKNGNAGSSAERNVTIKKGGEAVLKVAAQKGEDGSNLTYQWYQYHMEGMNEIKNAVGDSYRLLSSEVTEEPYIYSCIVDDGITNREVLFYITVENETSAVSIENCSISLSPDSAVYTGGQIKPKVTVKDGTKTLKEGTDYTLSYRNNTNIGTALVTITGRNNYSGNATKPFSITVKKGSAYTVGAYKYKITNGSEVSFAGLDNKKTTKVNVANTVKIGGKNFKVTSIDAKALRKTGITSVTVGNNVKTIGNSAFEGCSKLTKVTIGTGVTKIGTCTFKSCKKLGSITIKSAILKTVGKNALKGIKSNAKVKVPAKKMKDYKKLFKGKGQGKKVKITK